MFVWQQQRTAYTCFGLSSIGQDGGFPSASSSTSWALRRDTPEHDFAPMQLPSGVAPGQGARFSTVFQGEAQVFFGTMQLADCHLRCNLQPLCRGFFYWTPKQRCYALKDLGHPTATSLSGLAFVKKNSTSVLRLAYTGVTVEGVSESPRRFSTAFDASARVFRSTLGLRYCALECLRTPACRGVFLNGPQQTCDGLSDSGVGVTTSTVSTSWSRVTRRVAPENKWTPAFSVAYRGGAGQSDSLRFEAAFDTQARLFRIDTAAVESTGDTLDACKERCLRLPSCAAVWEWLGRACFGLSQAGRGVATNTSSVSWIRQPTQTP